MASFLRTSQALGSRLVSQQPKAIHCRFMSVINLSDGSAVEKFRMINHKSILYFTATWCPPCKVIKPIYEGMAQEHAAEIAFGKVDVDENSDAAMDFDITAVPTFVFFDGEKPIEKMTGADQNQLKEKVDMLLKR